MIVTGPVVVRWPGGRWQAGTRTRLMKIDHVIGSTQHCTLIVLFNLANENVE